LDKKQRQRHVGAGLPDFSRNNVPKRGQMYQPFTFQSPPKLYPNWDILFKNLATLVSGFSENVLRGRAPFFSLAADLKMPGVVQV
jgi:hypothetical protein